MSGLWDIYASQIAAARQTQFPQVGQRPINSGIHTQNVKPGYGEIGAGIGQIIGKAFIEPRVKELAEKYDYENNPKKLEERMKAGYETFNVNDRELPDSVIDAMQPTMLNYVQKNPTFAANVMHQDEKGRWVWNSRARTLSEAQAKEVPESERVEREYKTAQSDKAKAEATVGIPATADYHAATAADLKAKLPFVPAMEKASINEKTAQAGYYNRMPDTNKLLQLADKEKDKIALEQRKQVIGNYQARKMKIDADTSQQKLGGVITTPAQVEKALRSSSEAITLAQTLGANDPIVGAEASQQVDGLYGAFVRTSALSSNWIPQISIPGTSRYIGKRKPYTELKTYSEEQLTDMSNLKNKANELISTIGPYASRDAIKKWMWMEMVMDSKTTGNRILIKSYKEIPDKNVDNTIHALGGQ
jgi:hypothetical protein